LQHLNRRLNQIIYHQTNEGPIAAAYSARDAQLKAVKESRKRPFIPRTWMNWCSKRLVYMVCWWFAKIVDIQVVQCSSWAGLHASRSLTIFEYLIRDTHWENFLPGWYIICTIVTVLAPLS
jgi:hypothetical protein